MTRSIDLVYFNAGGGHRAAALALQEVMREQQRPWTVRLIDLAQVLDPKQSFRKFTGMAPEDLYNKRLARGWTLGMGQELRLLQGMIRLGHATMLRSLQQHWLATEPDMVVSLVPNFNRVLCESVASTLPGVPFVTVLTDLADHPPHFWIEPGQDQHLVCGTAHAQSQAYAAGYTREQVWLTTGMILRPQFHRPMQIDWVAERRALGLDPKQPTGVVMFGGQGSMQMLRMAKALGDVQLILMCGHNEALATELRDLRTPAAHAVLGFKPEVVRYLRLGDFFIGKPGPGSISEAIHLGLPVITVSNAWTLPQERFNARWLTMNGLGIVLDSFGGIEEAVSRILEGDTLAGMRARASRLENRAVWEIPDILESILGHTE